MVSQNRPFYILSRNKLFVEVAEIRKKKAALQKHLHQLKWLEQQYISNAAILPDLRPLKGPVPPPTAETILINVLHGLSNTEYRRIHNSVVGQVRFTLARCCNQLQGQINKQCLWMELRCPSITEMVQPYLPV